jgi:hypothetical protein
MHPPEVDAIRDELASLYSAVQQQQIAELERIGNDPSQRRRRARLNEQAKALTQALDEVDIQAKTWASTRLGAAYQIGAMEAAQATGQRYTWTQIHTAAVAEIASRTYDDLLAATRFVRRDVKRFVRSAVRARTAEAVIGGRTATQAGRLLRGDLRGIAAIRYANGARHSLGDYSSMVLRTTTGQAYVQGTINASAEAGVKYMECIDGPACGLSAHNDLELANGLVLPIDVANSYPLAHPNCARSWTPRPLVSNDAEAKAARRYSADEQQRLAEEERARAEVRTVEGRLTARERDRRSRLRAREARLEKRRRSLAERGSG